MVSPLTTGQESEPVHARGEGKGREAEGKESGARDAIASATREENNVHEFSAEFDAFWAIYPKRKGANPRTPAAKAFDAALRSGVAASALLRAVKAFAQAEAGKIDTEFIPMAVTWLTQRRFEEYGPDPGLLERLRAQAPMMRARGYELDEEKLAWRKVGAAA